MSSQDPRLVCAWLFVPSNDEKEKRSILTADDANFKESVSMGTSSKPITTSCTSSSRTHLAVSVKQNILLDIRVEINRNIHKEVKKRLISYRDSFIV